MQLKQALVLACKKFGYWQQHDKIENYQWVAPPGYARKRYDKKP